MYLFSYYIYPSVLLAVILAGQGVCAYLAYHKALRLASLTLHTRLVPYVNKGYVRAMKAWQLVPGDIIVVVPGQAVCDMVLLRGNCLVEESVLSGEVSFLGSCQWCCSLPASAAHPFPLPGPLPLTRLYSRRCLPFAVVNKHACYATSAFHPKLLGCWSLCGPCLNSTVMIQLPRPASG